MDMTRLAATGFVGVINLGLALIVYLRNRRSLSHRTFAMAVTMIVVWLWLAAASDQPAFAGHALLLNRLTLAAALVMGACLVAFSVIFPEREAGLTKWWKAFLGIGVALAAVTAFTPLVVAGITFESWGTNIVSGPLMPLMVIWFAAGITSIAVVLTRKMRRVSGRNKAQLTYLLVGLTLFALTSVLLGLVLPLITGSWQLSVLNSFASLLVVGFTSYAMIRHRLMDIRLVVVRSVAYGAVVIGLGVLLVLAAVAARAQLTQRMGISPDVLFVVVSLGAVLAFQPIHKALVHVSDGFFYRKTYDPQALLGRIGAMMASTLDLSELEHILSRELCIGMRLSQAAIAHTLGGKVEVIGTPEDFCEGEELHDLIVSCRHSLVFADDTDTDPRVAEKLGQMDVRVLAPLMSGGTVLGAILLGSKLSGEMFSAQDAAFLEILRGEASISIRNALLFEERNQRVRELSALNTLAWALGRDTQFEAVLSRALREVMQVTGAEAGSIMLLQPDGETLAIESAKGLPPGVAENTRIRLGEGIAGWVAQHRRPLVLVDAQDDAFGQELERQGIRSALSVPLVCKGEVIGVLNVSKLNSPEAFSKENLKIVASFAGQLAVAIENARLYVDLENTFLGTIGALAAAVDAKDPYTYGHSSSVTDHTMAIGKYLGLADEALERLRIAALLHDIGKIGIDGAILNKPGRLTPEEYQTIQSHPDIAANILGSLEFLHDIVPLVQHHHEHYDGGGYPAGLAGDAIPLGARIIAVADAFDAMTSDRPYRPALTLEEAVSELRRFSGTQFDPEVVDAFLHCHPEAGPLIAIA